MSEATEPSEPTSLVGLIEKLNEPAEPDAVSMVPQTPGWLVLTIVLVLVVGWLVWRGYKKWHANAYRRAALEELRSAGNNPASIAGILRRTALAAWPREEIAVLAGEEWLAFLDRAGGTGGFLDGPGRAVISAPYQPGQASADPALADLAERWIRQHKGASRGGVE